MIGRNRASSAQLEDLGIGGRLPGDCTGGGVHIFTAILLVDRNYRLDLPRPDGFGIPCPCGERNRRQSAEAPGVDPSGMWLRHRSRRTAVVDVLGVGGEESTCSESGRRVYLPCLDQSYSGFCSTASHGA